MESVDEEAAAVRAAYIEASGHPVCTSRDMRACRWYHYDQEGRLHCPMSIQICSDIGRWLPCGEYRFGADGEPQPVRSR